MLYECTLDKNTVNERTYFFKDKSARLIHNDNGPAVVYKSGMYKAWYIDGKIHREDGPAREWSSGNVEYWLNGEFYKEEEYWKEVAKIKFGGFV